LERSSEKLRELDRLKTEFVSNVSHELRTPLATIGMAVDNLLDGVAGGTSPVVEKYLSRVKGSADRLVRLINDLLDLSRIEAGRVELLLTRVPFDEVLHEVLDVLRPAAAEKRVLFKASAHLAMHAVWADRDKLHQMLINLIGNAVKFTPPGGEVNVTGQLVELLTGPDRLPSLIDPSAARGTDSPLYLEVSVADTGVGIPPEEREAIFEKFHQVRHEKQGKTAGTGLGLAIVKSLIELHGGRIRVESQVGQGSQFIFTLPLASLDGSYARGKGGAG